MNMFKPTKAKTVKEYMEALPADRRESVESLDAFIRKTAPSLKQHFAYNMLGYGSFPVKNSKKEMIQWPTVGIANQKQHISLYVCSVENGQYLAEAHKKELGKATVGKTCISFKKLDDLNMDGLKKVLKAAEKSPGLAGLGVGKK